MRYQVAALVAGLIAVLALAGAALAVWIIVSADDDQRRQVAAEAELHALQGALHARVLALQAQAGALLQDQRVIDFGARGPTSSEPPEVLRFGRVSRGGADYILVSGPGRSIVYEEGLAGSLVNGLEDSTAEALALLDGAVDGGVFEFVDGLVLVGGARAGGGSDRVAIALGVRLDAAALAAMTPGAARTVTLSWGDEGALPTSFGVHDAAAPGRATVAGPLDLARGSRPLGASIEIPATALPEPAATRLTRWLGVLVGAGVLGLLALGIVVRTMASSLSDVRTGLLSAQENDGNPLALDALAGSDEVGRTAEQAAVTLRAVGERTITAIDEARVATARQLLGEHVIRSMHEGVLVERSDGACIVCNPGAGDVLGVEPGSILGQRGALRAMLGGALYDRLVERARSPEASHRLDVVAIAGRDLAFDAYEVPEHRGEGASLIVIIRDVSAVLEVEQLKRDIVSVVSHELRTPLTVVALSIGMLSEPEADQAQLIDAAERNVQRMRELVDDLLDLARLESGEADPQREPHDLVALCHDVVQLLTPQAQEKGVTLREAVDGEAPLVVEVDRRQVQRAVTNLASNAIKFSPPGGDAWVVLRDGGDVIYIDVVDSGPGVPADEAERIFTRFYRASNTRDHVGGTGLGLPIVREIALLHGGDAQLLNAETGAYFRLTLPQ